MGELIPVIFWLLLVVLVWAVTGHLIWLFVAAAVRVTCGTRCTNCQRKFLDSSGCPRCRPATAAASLARDTSPGQPDKVHDPVEATPSIQADLTAAQRLLRYAEYRKWLTPEQFSSLRGLLERLTDRVQLESPTTSPTAPQALTTTPAPPPRVAPSSRNPLSTPVAPRPVVTASLRPADSEPATAASALAPPPEFAATSHSVLPPKPAALPHALDQAYVEPRPSQGNSAGQRLSAGVLKAFMEQSNIRWVEIVSASLIVVCSVGLVISLWSTLSSTSRFFPSMVFLLATVAVHAAGQYTLRRWKLRSTSRGILHIGLMLIPLAVLVGVLLSRRDNQLPQLDLGAWSTIAIGIIVYGSLAVTASRSLFGRFWLPVAAITIVCSLTLLPIHVLGQRGELATPEALLGLVPLLVAQAFSGLQSSRYCAGRHSFLPALTRRTFGMVTQSLFAAGVVLVFWWLQAGSPGRVSAGWWMVVCWLAVVWASWGWCVAWRGIENIQIRGPMGLFACGVAAVAMVVFTAGCLQTGFSRVQWIGLVGLAAAWWLLHGYVCRLRPTLFAGALALQFALALSVEWLVTGQPDLATRDWISSSRVVCLLLAAVTYALLVALFQKFASHPPRDGDKLSSVSRASARSQRRTIRESDWTVPMFAASGLTIAIAGGLTVLASRVPAGAVPYGGNWAPSLLLLYAAVGITAGIVLERYPLLPALASASGAAAARRSVTSSSRLGLGLILPVSLALCGLATLGWFQTSPVLEGPLADLRPRFAWAIGFAALSSVWAVLAAALRCYRFQSNVFTGASGQFAKMLTIDWLCLGSLGLIALSAARIWLRADEMQLAAMSGWLLPLTLTGVFLAWRRSHLRELALASWAGWLATLYYAVGTSNDWWSQLGLTASLMLLAIVFIALVAVDLLVRDYPAARKLGIGRRRAAADQPLKDRHDSAVGAAAAQKNPTLADESWYRGGASWASSGLLVLSWASLLLGILPTGAFQASAGLTQGRYMEYLDSIARAEDQAASQLVNSWLLSSLSHGAFVLVLTTLFVLTMTTIIVAKVRVQHFFAQAPAIVPLLIALAVASWVAPPFSMVAALWASAACWLVAEVAREKHSSVEPSQTLALALLSIGTLAIVVSTAFAMSPTQLFAPEAGGGTWLRNATRLLLILGPLVIVTLVGWAHRITTAFARDAQVLLAGMAALAIGCLAALAIPTKPTWSVSGIVFIQATALAASLLAWLTPAPTLVRNALGLQAISGSQSLASLLPKAMKGSRWRMVDSSSWTINIFSFGLAQALCLLAVLVVILRPIVGPSGTGFIDASQVGNAAVLLTFFVATSLFVWHALRRGGSRFGLLAVGLATLAPLGAAAYAGWAATQGSVQLLPPLAQQEALYVPYRMLLSLWLLALFIGLGVRIWASTHGQIFSKTGESLWVGLAVAVGGLALCTFPNEPNLYWPASQLSVLALIMAVSAVYAAQAWRGHVAAVTAAIGIWLMLRAPGQFTPLQWYGASWLSLWGPAWVAAVALAFQLGRQRTVQQSGYSVDQAVSIHLPIAAGVLSCVGLMFIPRLRELPHSSAGWIIGLSAAALGISVARLWDVRRGHRGLAVYVNLLSMASVLAVIGCTLAALPRAHSHLIWLASVLGAMAIMAGLLREALREHSKLDALLRLGTLTTDAAQLRLAAQWMSAIHLVFALLALVPSVLLVLAFEERTLRVAATVLPFLGALAILPISGYIAHRAIRYAGILLISTSFVLLWWADLPSAWAVVGPRESWIYWNRLFVALIALAVIYPAGVRWKWKESVWEAPLMHCGWIVLVSGIATGTLLLFAQWQTNWADSAADASSLSKVLTLLAWLVITGRLLQFAVAPFSTEQSAPIQWRKAAVYGAEVALVGTVGAGYFHYPNLFSGVFVQWWPLVLFAIAMLSAGLGEWLRRIGQDIVADPVSQSSLLLPAIPLAAVWWIQPPGLSWHWNEWSMYAFLLLSAAALYAMHGWLRDSIGARSLSGLLALFAFWSFLHSQPSLRFLEHPQFWLLPPALAMLAFIEFNRGRLEAQVVVAGRYLAVLTAYLSSSAEMIFTAFEGQLWQPLLLLVLALAGAAMGMVLQVRAFLYCGTAFVAVALVGMVWHAQQAIGQIWPWWAFGIATGVCLIVMLGYFEKNRPHVLAYLDQLKRWEP